MVHYFLYHMDIVSGKTPIYLCYSSFSFSGEYGRILFPRLFGPAGRRAHYVVKLSSLEKDPFNTLNYPYRI